MKNRVGFSILILCLIIFSQNFIYANTDSLSGATEDVYSCVLIESSSEEILFGNDENKIMQPASATEIMTAIIALENADLKKVLTVSQSAAKETGTCAFLIPGEKITLEDALKLMLVASAKECANVIAENVFGNKDEFVRKMNEKAKEIGALNTTYTNPVGLDGTDGMDYSNQQTTALDLALITRYAMNIEEFRNIVSMKTVTVPPTNMHKEARTFQNTNKLLDKTYEDFKITGVKAVYSVNAGNVFVSAAMNNEGIELISVVFGTDSNTVFNCTETLLKYGFAHPDLKEFSMRNKPYKILIGGRILSGEPKVTENSVLAPIKELSQFLKINLDWISEDKTIILEKNGKYVHMNIGKETAYINGSKIQLSHAPFIENGLSFVPLEPVAETFGYEIKTNSISKIVEIDSLPFFENNLSVSENVYYYCNSEPYEFKDIKIINDRVYVESNSIELLLKDKIHLQFFPDSRIIYASSHATYLEHKTEKYDHRIYIPLAALAKNLGIKIFWGPNTKTIHMYYQELSINTDISVEDLVPEHFVYATAKNNTPIYPSIGASKATSYIKGGKVEIIRDKDYKWYYIKNDTITGWTKSEYLSIDTKFEKLEEKLYPSETEFFVNDYFKLKSPTNYLIWVDLKRQLINIFTRSENSWKLTRQIPCATGKNISPTIKGTFSINNNRGTWMPAGNNAWVKNYVGFYSSYFFHSVKVKRNGTIYDNTLGTVASAGCIRMPLEDSEWFSNNIPVNTTVFIR